MFGTVTSSLLIEKDLKIISKYVDNLKISLILLMLIEMESNIVNININTLPSAMLFNVQGI